MGIVGIIQGSDALTLCRRACLRFVVGQVGLKSNVKLA